MSTSEHTAQGRWALFFPWIHSSALPVFAVIAVLMAVLWSAVQRWLADYERYAEDAARLGAAPRPRPAACRRLPARRARRSASPALRLRSRQPAASRRRVAPRRAPDPARARGAVVVPWGEEVCVQISTDLARSAVRRSRRALFVVSLGPLCALGGVVWALLQPYRITLLHPYGQGFWWLLSEPPLYVVLVGLALPLVRRAERGRGSRGRRAGARPMIAARSCRRPSTCTGGSRPAS